MSEIILKSAADEEGGALSLTVCAPPHTQSGAEGACFNRRRNELRQRRIILS